jgi:hypothetical protein
MKNNLSLTDDEKKYNDKYIIEYNNYSFYNIIYYDIKLSDLSYLSNINIDKNIIRNDFNIVYINNNSDENNNN